MGVKGMIIPITGGGGPFVFQYNPEEVSESYAATWVPLRVAGRELPYQQYSNGEENMLEFMLRFASEGNPSFVKDRLKALKGLMKPSAGGSAGLKAASILVVILGGDINGKYTLKHMRSRKHTYADKSLLWYFGEAHLQFSAYSG